MKTNKKYAAIIAFIILAAIDAVTLILTKTGQYDPQFWMGFVFIQVSFLGYILTKLFVKDDIEARGIRPLDTVLFLNIVIMLLMGLVAYLAPYKTNVFTTLLVFYIIITSLCVCASVLTGLNKKLVKEARVIKPRIFNQNNIIDVLEETKHLVADEALKEQVQIIIDQINGLQVELNSLKGKQLVEYVQFMYKNATRKEIDNLFNNINKVKEILKEIK